MDVVVVVVVVATGGDVVDVVDSIGVSVLPSVVVVSVSLAAAVVVVVSLGDAVVEVCELSMLTVVDVVTTAIGNAPRAVGESVTSPRIYSLTLRPN